MAEILKCILIFELNVLILKLTYDIDMVDGA